jgi:hypothetical protein
MTSTENGCFLRTNWLAVLLFLAVFLVKTPTSHGQTYPAGEILVGNGTSTIQSSLIVLDAVQFSKTARTQCGNKFPLSNDMAGQIQAAICSLPATGGTVDARGFNSAQTVGSAWFGDPGLTSTNGYLTLTTKPVTLLLPASTVTTNVTQFLPTLSKTIGQNQTATTIKWGGAAQGSTNCTLGSGSQTCVPVVCMGKPDPTTQNCDTPATFTNTPRTQISGVRIDCADIAYMFGLVDITAQEQSWFQNGGAENCQGTGVYIGPTGHNNSGMPAGDQVQNAGPFTNLEINYGNSSKTSTLGMYVQGGPSITVGIGGHITFNQVQGWSGTNRPNTALSVNGFQVSVADIHCENYVNDCVLIGSVIPALGVSVHSITSPCNVGQGVANIVHVSSANHVTGVASAVGGLGGSCSGFSTAILDDQSSFNTGTSQQAISEYWIGKGTDTNNLYAQGQSGAAQLTVAGTLTAGNLGGNFSVNTGSSTLATLSGNMLGSFQAPNALTAQNITCQAAALSCSTNLVFTFCDCATSSICTSPTTIGTCTVVAANTVVTVSLSSPPAINTGDILIGKITSGVCTTLANAGATLAY